MPALNRSPLLQALLEKQITPPQRMSSYGQLAAELGSQLIRQQQIKGIQKDQQSQTKAIVDALGGNTAGVIDESGAAGGAPSPGASGRGDPQRALMMALQNPEILQGNPMLAQILMGQFDKEATPFGKIDPKDYTPESVAAFSQTRDYTKLRGKDPDAKKDNIESYFATVSTGEGKQIQARVYEAPDGSTFMLGGGGRKVPLTSEQISAPITRQEVRQGQLTASTVTELQKDIAGGEAIVSQLDALKKNFDPNFLTYAGRFRIGAGRMLDKAGVAPDSEKKFLGDARKFNQGVSQVFNDYRRQITGAAAAIQELEKLKDAVLNTDLGPTEFEAAFDQFRSAISRGNEVKRRLLEQGLEAGTPEFAKAFDQAFTGLSEDEQNELRELEARYGNE